MGKARIFTTEEFDNFACDERLGDDTWIKVVDDMERGLGGDELGSGAFKHRVARAGAGKSRGYRIIVVFRREDRAVFVKGYAKNVQSTLGPRETAAYRQLAGDLPEPEARASRPSHGRRKAKRDKT